MSFVIIICYLLSELHVMSQESFVSYCLLPALETLLERSDLHLPQSLSGSGFEILERTRWQWTQTVLVGSGTFLQGRLRRLTGCFPESTQLKSFASGSVC